MVIYMTTNLINGKKYIGRDQHNKKWYLGSGAALTEAVKKYGRQNFKKEIIEECKSIEELKEREGYWLQFYDAGNNRDFYNFHNYSYGGNTTGFLGKKHSDESKKKIGKSVSGEKNGFYGKKHKVESRKRMGRDVSKEKNPMFGKGHLLSGKKNGRFKSNIVCVKGIHKGKSMGIQEWVELLNVSRSAIYNHINRNNDLSKVTGVKYNILKREIDIK